MLADYAAACAALVPPAPPASLALRGGATATCVLAAGGSRAPAGGSDDDDLVSLIAAIAAVVALVLAPLSAILGAQYAAREQRRSDAEARQQRREEDLAEAIVIGLAEMRTRASEAHYTHQWLLALRRRGGGSGDYSVEADLRRAMLELHAAVEALTAWASWKIVQLATRAGSAPVATLADEYAQAVPRVSELERELDATEDELPGAVDSIWEDERVAYERLVAAVRWPT
ncbi:MAG TPA: hypothetical protein VF712_20035 [Thermoleophilaceae bacterium]|jgi:hypothetical protein